MTPVLEAFNLLLIALAGWLHRQHQARIDYLIEEKRVLEDQPDGQWLRYTDEQRIRQAEQGRSSPFQQQG